jgi:hypothetical protein
MARAIGIFVDLAVGLVIMWFGVAVRQQDLRDVLPVAIWACVSLAALLGAVGHAWGRGRELHGGLRVSRSTFEDIGTVLHVPGGVTFPIIWRRNKVKRAKRFLDTSESSPDRNR